MSKDIRAWLGVTFESSSGLTPEFSRFANVFKAAIQSFLSPSDRFIGWSRGHFYCAGFIQRGDRFVYFSISDVRHFPRSWYNEILIRTAKNEKDYTGGPNHYTDLPNFRAGIDRLFGGHEKRIETPENSPETGAIGKRGVSNENHKTEL